MDSSRTDEQIAAFLNTLNRGQYLILLEAIRQAGGEIRIDQERFERAAATPLQMVSVDASDGPVVIRIIDPTESEPPTQG